MTPDEAYEMVEELRSIANNLEKAADLRNLPRNNALWMASAEWYAIRKALSMRAHAAARRLVGDRR